MSKEPLPLSEESFTTRYHVFTLILRSGEWIRDHRAFMSIVLAAADLLAVFISWALAILGCSIIFGLPIPQSYETYAILLLLVLLVNSGSGLYNHNISEVEELRRLCKSTSIYYLIIASILFLFVEEDILSRLVIVLAWVYSMLLVPLLRELIRSTFVHMGMWGEPVVIFGNGRLGNEVAAYLRKNPKMGYNPVGMVDRRKEKRENSSDSSVIHDAAVFTNGETTPTWLKGVRTAFVVTPETSQSVYEMLIGEQTIRFEQLIMVRSDEKTGSLWVQPLDIGGILGLKVGQNLLNRGQLQVKRMMDLSLIILSIPIWIPVFGLIALLIKHDSKGGVFYRQDRIGYGGNIFKLWKFRSMCVGAEQKLEEYLAANPDRKAEFEVNHKLVDDPRLTRIGKILRRLSLDELPQLINVLEGGMSLVGPRPFMPSEIGFYKKCYSLYTYVLPGMTGLWQISGRSNVSYATRASLDDYYLRNWSIWLDIHILIRTFLVVVRRDGAR